MASYFSSVDEVMLAYKDHIVGIHAPIKVRVEQDDRRR